MTRAFKALREAMPPHAQRKACAKTAALMREMKLSELRQDRKLSQEQMAESLNIKQASISKLERRADMYISTLRNFIQAMGGELEITARFPEGSIKLKQFDDRA